MCFCFFFCKQKTAVAMRMSDWSLDVCSSDLADRLLSERVPASPSEKRMLQSLMCLPFSTVMDQWFGCLRLPHFQMGVPCRLGWFNASGDGDHILPHGRSEERRVGKEGGSTCRSGRARSQ